MANYQPKTGARCACKRGIERDNCPTCEGTGWVIDFAAIHRARRESCTGRFHRDSHGNLSAHTAPDGTRFCTNCGARWGKADA